MFFYSDDKEKGSGFTSEPNATVIYLSHYRNLLFLQFISRKSDDRVEKAQALKELTICERKLAYWYKHKNFDKEKALKEIQKLKRDWNETSK